jgi:hypothetical protein
MMKYLKIYSVLLGVLMIGNAFGQESKNQKFELYILIGQSNMAGRGNIDEAFKNEGNDSVLMFDRSNKWVIAKHPLHFDKPKAAGVGPGLAFGISMAKANPKIKIGLIPCAVGGTPIERWQPGAYDAATKTHPWDDAAERIKLAMAYGVVKGVIWHQGEGNSSPQKAKIYLTQLTELIKRVRQLVNDPELPFVAGELGRYREAYGNINEQLKLLPGTVPLTAVASSKGLIHKGDSTHFDGRSAQKLGERFAVKMLKIQRRLNKSK